MNLFSDYDFAFGGGRVTQTGGRRYKSGPGAKKAIPKKPRLKLRVVDGKLKYVPKKLRKRSGRNVFISEYAKKYKVSGPALMKKGNAAWRALSKAQKDKYETKADSMGFKPAAKTRQVAKRFVRRSPVRAGAKRRSPKRKSPKRKSPKRKSKSPKRKSKSPKRKSKSPKRKSKSPRRKSPRCPKQRGSGCGNYESYQYFGGADTDEGGEEDPLNSVQEILGGMDYDGEFMF